jgi:hypothetical protein
VDKFKIDREGRSRDRKRDKAQKWGERGGDKINL